MNYKFLLICFAGITIVSSCNSTIEIDYTWVIENYEPEYGINMITFESNGNCIIPANNDSIPYEFAKWKYINPFSIEITANNKLFNGVYKIEPIRKKGSATKIYLVENKVNKLLLIRP